MSGWWIAFKVGAYLVYWYPVGRAWGYEAVPDRYFGVMIGKGHPPS